MTKNEVFKLVKSTTKTNSCKIRAIRSLKLFYSFRNKFKFKIKFFENEKNNIIPNVIRFCCEFLPNKIGRREGRRSEKRNTKIAYHNHQYFGGG